MKIFITGFEPVGGDKVNPAWEAMKALPEEIEGITIVKKEIPVVFGEGFREVQKTILSLTCPGQGGEASCDQRCDGMAAVICVGVAGGRTGITPEKIAVNYSDARIPDNAGNSPQAEKILPEGPDGHFTTLPAEAMVREMKEEGIPAYLSLSAGAYVCNDVFYRLMDFLSKGGLLGDAHIREVLGRDSAIGGFIHVPYSKEMLEGKDFAGKALPPSLPLADITRGLEICLRTVVRELKKGQERSARPLDLDGVLIREE